jgi:hypothetical protein
MNSTRRAIRSQITAAIRIIAQMVMVVRARIEMTSSLILYINVLLMRLLETAMVVLLVKAKKVTILMRVI